MDLMTEDFLGCTDQVMGKQPIDDSIIIRGNQVKGLRFLMGIVSESIPKQRDQSAVVSIRRVRVDDTKPGA